MGCIISVMNQKGGVGKSTTSQNLQAALSQKNFKVLLIDLDPQGNTTCTSGLKNFKSTAYELITGKSTAQEAIHASAIGDIVPAGNILSKASVELTDTGKEYRLREVLGSIKDKYDYIVIDTPPSLGILAVNALVASDKVIIPSQADVYSLQGISQLFETIDAVKKYCNSSLKVEGILLTRYNKRTVLSKDLTNTLSNTATNLNTFVYKAAIRECISLKEAQASNQNIFKYAPKSNAGKDYLSFSEELIQRVENGKKEL